MYSKVWPEYAIGFSSKTKDKLYGKNGHDKSSYLKIGKLNFFIGANNSGKSMFLRELFKSQSLKLVLNGIIRNAEDKKDIINLIHPDKNIRGIDQLAVYCTLCGKIETINEQVLSLNKIDHLKKLLLSNILKFSKNDKIELLESIDGFNKHKDSLKTPEKNYIPILRGMRPLIPNDFRFHFDSDITPLINNGHDTLVTKICRDSLKNEDLYKKRTIKDYFDQSIQNHVYTGFELYSMLTKLLLGKPEEREKVKKYESILSKDFFEEEVVLIPEHDSDTVSVKIGDASQRPIYSLGDGIQQVIIITSCVYFANEDTFFFIEEPENHMHPGLLRKLAEFLYKQNGQFFFTTHSNHLLDLAEIYDDVFIHKFTKLGKEEFHISESSKIKDILSDLGVRPSSVYLTNCTIWVEGITDRFYLRCYMKKYVEARDDDEKERLKKYIENSHYAFVEYQGGNIPHWDFEDPDVNGGKDRGLSALKTTSNILLIADRDIENKGNNKDILENQLGECFIMTNGKEIENLLPEKIIRLAVKKIYQNKRVRKNKNGEITFDPKKGVNIDDIDLLKESSYSNSSKGIGFHIDEILKKDELFGTDSGTVRDKVKFCKTAVEIMNENEWELTKDLEDLCKKIFDHIESHNK